MSKKKAFSVINIYQFIFQALRNQPKLWIPYVGFTLLELFFLIFLYLAPRQPFAVLLAPPIRAFWGEKFLHYPVNFLLLPKLASLSRNFLACIFGSLLTGFAVAMVVDVYYKKNINALASLKAAFKKYLYLFAVVLLITVLFFSLIKIIEKGLLKYFLFGHATLLFLKPQVWLGPILIIINLLIVILVQGLLVYAIPIIMTGNGKLFKAIGRSMVMFTKLFLPTLFLVGLPILAYLPIIVLQFNTPFLINRFLPEAVLYVCIAAAIINSLVVDLLVTFSSTILYLQNKDLICEK